MSLTERFLRYISYDTQSNEDSSTIPSTSKQWALSNVLYEECLSLFDQVEQGKDGIIYATLEATKVDDSIGFLAHMDTATEISGANVSPQRIQDYEGQSISLKNGLVINPEIYPALKQCIHDDLIVTDGNTLLGGDDKAGIAIILTAIEQIRAIPHGKICVAFTVDEEIGRGTDTFDLQKFPVDYAYTIDGDRIDDVEYENFNAAQATITIQGSAIHPGEGKDKLVNASLLAMDFAHCIPHDQTPAHTQGREGFFHLIKMDGDVAKARLVYIIRDHDATKFARKKALMQNVVDALNDKYGQRFSIEMHDQYHNMAEFMSDMTPVNRAKQAIQYLGIEPVSIPIRGGTDGAMLSEKGLSCPNLGTGTFLHHGPREFASITKMEQMVDILVQMIKGI